MVISSSEVPAEITFYDNHDVELIGLSSRCTNCGCLLKSHGDNQD